MKMENTELTFDKKFYDDTWEKWLDMKKFGPMSRHTRRLCLDIIKNLDIKSVLDVGCGQGSFLEHLESLKQGISLSGVDISDVAVKNAARLLPNAKFHVADLQKEFLNEKFDLVTCIDVIEHIPDDIGFLNNLSKMSGKYLLIATLSGRMRPFEKNVGHVRNYSESELVGKIKNAGFEIVKVKKWGFPFYSPLYRNVCQAAPSSINMGKFGLIKKIISQVIYLLFFLNSNTKGDSIIILSKSSNSR